MVGTLFLGIMMVDYRAVQGGVASATPDPTLSNTYNCSAYCSAYNCSAYAGAGGGQGVVAYVAVSGFMSQYYFLAWSILRMVYIIIYVTAMFTNPPARKSPLGLHHAPTSVVCVKYIDPHIDPDMCVCMGCIY